MNTHLCAAGIQSHGTRSVCTRVGAQNEYKKSWNNRSIEKGAAAQHLGRTARHYSVWICCENVAKNKGNKRNETKVQSIALKCRKSIHYESFKSVGRVTRLILKHSTVEISEEIVECNPSSICTDLCSLCVPYVHHLFSKFFLFFGFSLLCENFSIFFISISDGTSNQFTIKGTQAQKHSSAKLIPTFRFQFFSINTLSASSLGRKGGRLSRNEDSLFCVLCDMTHGIK